MHPLADELLSKQWHADLGILKALLVVVHCFYQRILVLFGHIEFFVRDWFGEARRLD